MWWLFLLFDVNLDCDDEVDVDNYLVLVECFPLNLDGHFCCKSSFAVSTYSDSFSSLECVSVSFPICICSFAIGAFEWSCHSRFTLSYFDFSSLITAGSLRLKIYKSATSLHDLLIVSRYINFPLPQGRLTLVFALGWISAHPRGLGMWRPRE